MYIFPVSVVIIYNIYIFWLGIRTIENHNFFPVRLVCMSNVSCVKYPQGIENAGYDMVEACVLCTSLVQI